MISGTRTFLLCTVGVALVSCAEPASAVAANCRGDKRVDVPMQVALTRESAGRVHLSAYGGSDKTGWVAPYSWTLYNSSGKRVDTFPTADIGFASPFMLAQTNLEGLTPGASYSVELVSYDLCGRMGTVRQSFTMPVADQEQDAPVLSTPTTVRTGFQTAISTAIEFSATDRTGIRHLAVYVNGTLLTEYTYFDGKSFRWWVDPYTLDNVQSTLEGPNFYVYATAYAGQLALVEVVAEDIFGNTYTTSAELWL